MLGGHETVGGTGEIVGLGGGMGQWGYWGSQGNGVIGELCFCGAMVVLGGHGAMREGQRGNEGYGEEWGVHRAVGGGKRGGAV